VLYLHIENLKRNEMKFYRYGMNFYKIGSKGFEKVMAYKHHVGIEKESSFSPDMEELEEITEMQYNRVKRLILKKLILCV